MVKSFRMKIGGESCILALCVYDYRVIRDPLRDELRQFETEKRGQWKLWKENKLTFLVCAPFLCCARTRHFLDDSLGLKANKINIGFSTGSWGWLIHTPLFSYTQSINCDTINTHNFSRPDLSGYMLLWLTYVQISTMRFTTKIMALMFLHCTVWPSPYISKASQP